MSFFYIEPEVSGSLGPKTLMNTSIHPPVVDKLNYQFDSWLGDDLVESFPCYIITEHLSKLLVSNNFSGFSLDSVLVTRSDNFFELNGKKDLPQFLWLKIDGDAYHDDFGLSDDYRLVISQKVMDLLRLHNINHSDIEKI